MTMGLFEIWAYLGEDPLPILVVEYNRVLLLDKTGLLLVTTMNQSKVFPPSLNTDNKGEYSGTSSV